VRLRASGADTRARDKVQSAIEGRLKGYPRRAIEMSRHVVRAVLPKTLARLLLAYPQLVSVALDHLPPPPSSELLQCRRNLNNEESRIRFDCEGLEDSDMTCIGIRFTQCQYARLLGLRMDLAQRFSMKHWRQPRAANVGEKAMRVGATMCAGLEAAYLQGPKSASAVLCWPAPNLCDKLLPTCLPWLADTAFASYFSSLRRPIDAKSTGARRAFHQLSQLDVEFRPCFVRALQDEGLLEAIEFDNYWRDHDDDDAWLCVPPHELDTELQSRQAEFDAFDRRHGKHAQQETNGQSGQAATSNEVDEMRKKLAAMGQEISGLFQRASCMDGVDVASDCKFSPQSGGVDHGKLSSGTCNADDVSDTDGSGSGDLDILGMEEEPSSDDEDSDEGGESAGRTKDKETIYEYMAEMDEQLEQALDSGCPESDAKGAAKQHSANGLPLGSHHVKVNSAEPLEIDLHAMEHVLASYCSEHQLEPGPASLLLGELGLAHSIPHSPKAQGCVVSSLDSMD